MIKINPDKTIVQAIRNRLKITDGYCPCVAETEWTEDHVCPCKEFRDNKYCCCQLYIYEKDDK